MESQLTVTLGQYSDKGTREVNQDFHGACIPHSSQLDLKGIALAIADGISSSDVSHIASETVVKNFLEDYYCTSDAWSVLSSVQKVLIASNSWLYSQGQTAKYKFESSYDQNKGYVCTLSAMILKSNTAYIFHVGDTRIYRVCGKHLEQLTKDHRLWIDEHKNYLSRAIGIDRFCEIDYQSITLQEDDVFVIASAGVYQWLGEDKIADIIYQYRNDFDMAAKEIVTRALKAGSNDNLTVQVVRIDSLPIVKLREVQEKIFELPLPPVLEPRMKFDGYKIQRKLHTSSRSHVYLAKDIKSGDLSVIKAPSIDFSGDPVYLERLLTQEWISRKINSDHVLKVGLQERPRQYLYTVSEFLRGKTLTQWVLDNPKPNIEAVRDIVAQIAKGLQAFHRLEILHQNIQPDNIMIDNDGTVKIIDFGSVKVAGFIGSPADQEKEKMLNLGAFNAPEYFLSARGTVRSELFSLGMMTYYMLSGRLPYGIKITSATTSAAQKKLSYVPISSEDDGISLWVDAAIKKAVNINPSKRYEEISEFIFDLSHPNKSLLSEERMPLLQRNPVIFWQGVSAGLLLIVIYLIMPSS
ncbi:MAG: serine/threonine protein phosphatase PrpC [Colwellia sp.]|jgi:serine/threonine protein phosphatase PrpC